MGAIIIIEFDMIALIFTGSGSMTLGIIELSMGHDSTINLPLSQSIDLHLCHNFG
ncbi:hypothetical protein [Photobacterium profundum]|nr:hypothetical protein [Photobacterium profundum]